MRPKCLGSANLHLTCHLYHHSPLLPRVMLFFLNCTLGSGVHVQIMQERCTGTYMARWFAASMPLSHGILKGFEKSFKKEGHGGAACSPSYSGG